MMSFPRKPRTRRTCARRLLFEPLEDRHLLSGGTLSLDIVADSIAENAGSAATTATVTRSTAPTPETKLTADDAAPGDEFGSSVALSDTTAVIQKDSGETFIFELSGGTWHQSAELTADDGSTSFSKSVAVSGTTAIVSRVGQAAYIFEKTGGTWTQVAKKLPGNEGNFGASVAIMGTTAVVGASAGTGAAYVFERVDGEWTEVAKLTAFDATSGDAFGASVSIFGATVVIGAPDEDNENGYNAGAAYVFEQTDGTWAQVAKIVAGKGLGYFGQSVSTSGTTTVVGAVGDVYIFERLEGSVPAAVAIPNGADAAVFTIRGVDDSVMQGSQSATITAMATGYAGGAGTVQVTDDDTAGITVSTIAGDTTEPGGMAAFTIVLESEPVADVAIGIKSNDESEGKANRTDMTFTQSNWYVPQIVFVTGVQDDVDDGEIVFDIVTDPAISLDDNYNGLNPTDVSVTNVDDDTAGITVIPTVGLLTNEAGGRATFAIVLDSKPTGDVNIDLTSSDVNEGTTLSTSVTFTADTWADVQMVTVTGVDDKVDDGDVTYTIETGAATSDDIKYGGLDAADVSVTNQDNDIAGFTVVRVGNIGSVQRGVECGTGIGCGNHRTSGDAGEVVANRARLTFTPANWDEAQSVAVYGVDDYVPDGDKTTTITLSVDDTNSADAFNLLADQTFLVSVVDDGYHGWQNQMNQFDMDGDGGVFPQDVLDLINYINTHTSDLTLPAPPGVPPSKYYDVNDDGACTAHDVLMVINYINSPPPGSGEGESFAFPIPAFAIERPSPIVPLAENGRISAQDERAVSRSPTVHAADDKPDGTRHAFADAVWDEAALEELDAAFTELEAVLPELAAGLA